ncbi:MAG: Zn-ribbon domain-containing OB-fold protein [Alphaproteobacteria bacterium]|nr:Zn-ribbon domain-containing OB-fold protein [Alphaproteobacteria bacterium]
MTPEAMPYWDGLREGKLMLPKCGDCGTAFFYPRILCPHCHSRNVGWIQASGKGKLFSFEIAYRTFNPAFKVEAPFILAMVELEEGPRMMSNLINIEPDPSVVKCDMAVEVVFEKQTDEVTLALFQPAR